MKYVLLGIVAVIGLFALAESLTCNTCPVGLVGICLSPSTTTCTTNTSVCTTSKASFPSISFFVGFTSLNCLESAQCNVTTNGTILGATYNVAQTCCNTDKCNTLQSGASYVQVSITAVLSTALLACVWGQSVY
ncbi:lymphocyte antigen-6, epidermis [Tachysurus fulvidraco]|uniref:lymphocyte antigen-6, epidermis n=1 Tax=Tachysurus fulvidraco TaxID=1234273 RepID=UPI000F500B45|nr:lymphocyte antigen-6, epidermis [Tachysurus fulvidraco]